MVLESDRSLDEHEKTCLRFINEIVQSCEYFCQEAFFFERITFPGMNGDKPQIQRFKKATDVLNFSVQCFLSPEEQMVLVDSTWWDYCHKTLLAKGIKIERCGVSAITLSPVLLKRLYVFRVPEQVAKTINPTPPSERILWK